MTKDTCLAYEYVMSDRLSSCLSRFRVEGSFYFAGIEFLLFHKGLYSNIKAGNVHGQSLKRFNPHVFRNLMAL